jgi:hypothetical protein
MSMHGYGSLSFFSILWFFLWIVWIFLLIRIISDVFRSADLSGGAKAGWTLLLLIFPFIGALLYLVFRGSDIHTRDNRHAVVARAALQQSLHATAFPAASTADEIDKLASLRDRGLLTDDEYANEKARLLSSSAARTA